MIAPLPRVRVARFPFLAVIAAMLIGAPVRADTTFHVSFGRLEPDGPSPDLGGLNTSAIRWGTPNGPNDHSSSLAYTAYPVPTDYVLSGRPFACGRFHYENGTINLGTGINAATMFFSVMSDDDTLDSIAPFPERMETVSTPNTGTPDENADFLVFSALVPDIYPDYFNVRENEWADADVIVKLERLDLALELNRPGSPSPTPRFALRMLGFANVQGNGFLTDHAIGNRPPNCFGNGENSLTLWPPNHAMYAIDIAALLDISDPEGDPVTVTVTRITQDEPVTAQGSGDQAPDGLGITSPGVPGGGIAYIRAERSGRGNGRAYRVEYQTTDAHGGRCLGTLTVNVPLSIGQPTAIDDGQWYDSSGP